MATFYLDQEGGSDAADGTTFANRWKTITSGATAARIAPGDIIRVMASPDPQSLGISATWTNKSKTVALASALTLNVDLCETAWTASPNVTATAITTRKEGANSSSLAIASAFTTGLVAYKAFASTNFSAYRQISFWIRMDLSTLASGVLELRLCSDAAGVTAVDTFVIPALNGALVWRPITINKGSALGAAIQSVALYAVSDPGTVTILLDDIIACKDATAADALSLTDVIGKNTSGETFWPIQSINGTTVLLDAAPECLASDGRGYSGTTESVTTYRRQTIAVDNASAETVQDSGTVGSLITFSGGWNRTDMSTQTGETWWRQARPAQALITLDRNYIAFDRFGLVRSNVAGLFCTYAGSFDKLGCELSNMHCNGNGDGMDILNLDAGQFCFTGDIYACANGTASAVDGLGIYAYNGAFTTISISQTAGILRCHSNLYQGFMSDCSYLYLLELHTNNNYWGNLFSGDGVVRRLVAKDCNNYNVQHYSSSRLRTPESLTTSGGGGGFFSILVYGSAKPRAKNVSVPETTPCVFQAQGALVEIGGMGEQKVMNEKWSLTVDNHLIFTPRGRIISETGADRHTASGIAWKMSPADTLMSAEYPMVLPLAKIAVDRDAMVTVKAWMKRSNTALTGKLVCKGGQLTGVAYTVSASVSAAAGTYEELTITFLPQEHGTIEIEAHAFGGTTHNLWIDDMTITQSTELRLLRDGRKELPQRVERNHFPWHQANLQPMRR